MENLTNTRSVRNLVASLLLLYCWGGPLPAQAMHEADHRFTVYGTVRTPSGDPLSNAKVMITNRRAGEGTTVFSERDGSYSATLHLHNDNLGDLLSVIVADQEQTVRVSFDPSDSHTERKTHVDFGPVVEEPGGGRGWVWAGGVAVLLGVAVYWGVRHRPRKVPQRAKARAGRKT